MRRTAPVQWWRVRARRTVSPLVRFPWIPAEGLELDIADWNVLAQIAARVGLDATHLQMRLASEWKRYEVMAANEYSVSRGARSVPSCCLDGEYIDKTVDLITRVS